MLSGSGIGSLGIGVGVDPFLGGSFGGMPDFGPGGIGGALGVPLGVDFNVNIGNASNLDLLNRVAAAVNERYPTQTSEPTATPTVAPTSQPAPAVGTQYTGIAAQELTGDPDMDRMILEARDAQSARAPSGKSMADYQADVEALRDWRNLPENVAYRQTVRPEIKALIAAGLTPFIPGAAAGLAGSLGIGGALGSAAVGSALGAGAAAITDQDIAKGALTGALGGFGKGALDTGGTLGLGQSGSGVASLADTARLGADVSDKVGGIETLGDLAKIAKTGYDIYKDYEDAKRPGYTPDLPGAIDVVDLDVGEMGAPDAPGVEVDKPVFPDIDEEKTTQTQPGGSEGGGGGGGQTESGGEETTTVEVDDETSTITEDEDGTVTVTPEGQGETEAVSEAEDGTVTVEPDGQPAADGQDGAATDAAPDGGDETVVVDVEDRYAGTPYEGRSEGLILDGWLPNGPWRYEGEGIFREINTGEVLYDPTLPEDIRVGDRFDRGQANDATETGADAGDTQEAAVEDTGETGDEETVTVNVPVIPPGGGETSGGETDGTETGGADTGAPEGGEEETITVNIPETPTGGTETGGTETGGGETGGAETGGAETGGGETGGAETGGTETGGGETGGGETGGADGDGEAGDGTGEGSGDGEAKVGDGQLDGEGEGSGTSTGDGTGTGTGPGTGDGTGGGTGTGTGTGTGSGSGTGTGTGSGSGTGTGGGGQKPPGGGIQSLLPLLGMFLLGQQLLGGSGSSPRGRVPLEQESATGYYNIDREVRRRMGLGG